MLENAGFVPAGLPSTAASLVLTMARRIGLPELGTWFCRGWLGRRHRGPTVIKGRLSLLAHGRRQRRTVGTIGAT